VRFNAFPIFFQLFSIFVLVPFRPSGLVLELFLRFKKGIDRGLSTVATIVEHFQQLKQPGEEHAVFVSILEVVLLASGL